MPSSLPAIFTDHRGYRNYNIAYETGSSFNLKFSREFGEKFALRLSLYCVDNIQSDKKRESNRHNNKLTAKFLKKAFK